MMGGLMRGVSVPRPWPRGGGGGGEGRPGPRAVVPSLVPLVGLWQAARPVWEPQEGSLRGVRRGVAS